MSWTPQLRHDIVRRITTAAPEVREVLLFGSRARGDAREDSDVDLVLLVPPDADRRAVAIRAHTALWGLDLGFDLLVLTDADWHRLQRSAGWYDREIVHDAVRLDAQEAR